MKRLTAVFLIMLLLCGCNISGDKATPDSAAKYQIPTLSATRDEAFVEPEYSEKSASFEKIISGVLKARSKKLEVEEIFQNPELPTGCESVALTIALRYLGFELEKTTIADSYMPYGENMVFAYGGDPYSFEGAGVYPPGLVIAAENFLSVNSDKYYAVDLTETELSDLYKLIEAGFPVVAWHTMYMHEPSFDFENDIFENGREYLWYLNEHCLVICGYDLDKNTVTVSDPLSGLEEYDATEFERIFNATGKMSMAVLRKR